MSVPVALNFEAGGDPTVCASMLDILSAARVPATIFLAGNWSEQYPELVRRISSDGHELGNHSYTHPDLTLCPDAQIRDELRRTDEAISRITGERANRWFRPPYDAIDARVAEIARDEGYQLVQRSALDGGHWPGETTPELVRRRSLDNAYAGAVLTYHLDSAKTLAVLSDIIEDLRATGYELVRLADLPSVSERPERHPDFAALELEPGYLQVLKRGSRAWSLNLIEYGARGNAPANTQIPLAADGSERLRLLTAQAVTEWQPASEHDRYLFVVAGTPECFFRTRDDPEARIRAVGAAGDLILWSKDYEFNTGVSQHSWIMLIIE